MSRFGRKLDIETARGELPLSVFFFDCLRGEGGPHRPSCARAFPRLSDVLPETCVPRVVTADVNVARGFLDAALARGHGGHHRRRRSTHLMSRRARRRVAQGQAGPYPGSGDPSQPNGAMAAARAGCQFAAWALRAIRATGCVMWEDVQRPDGRHARLADAEAAGAGGEPRCLHRVRAPSRWSRSHQRDPGEPHYRRAWPCASPQVEGLRLDKQPEEADTMDGRCVRCSRAGQPVTRRIHRTRRIHLINRISQDEQLILPRSC